MLVSNFVKTLTITQKLVKLKIKLLLSMIVINKLLLKNLISLHQKLSRDIVNFVKKADLNKNELNELSKKVKTISTKRFTKDVINKFSILNGAKYFF